MGESRKCNRCGKALSPDAPGGHCPECLLELAMAAAGTETIKVADLAGAELEGGPDHPGIGTRVKYFGDYELIEEIARGGMGAVWKARQVSLNRTVALKMILSGHLATAGEVQRFLVEAEAAANLQHPNIVAIHEVGEHEGQHYFSMDYVEGENLEEHLRRHCIGIPKAVQLVKTIAEAVHFAHQRGILHRDLKPSNILIDAADQPRITDFGLAKRLGIDSGMTRTGAVIGSPSYMPPEQAGGNNELAGPARDVYSLGAILYFLLTGRPPFRGETAMATVRKVLDDEPVPPGKLNPKIPPDLETICLKCLEKQPGRRYATARQVADELDRFLNFGPILARPAGAGRKIWNWTQRHPWAIAGLASGIGLGLVGVAYGLWEQLQHVCWENLPAGIEKESRDRSAQFSPPEGYLLSLFLSYCILGPATLYARFLNHRQQRGERATGSSLAILAGVAVLGATKHQSIMRHYTRCCGQNSRVNTQV